MNGDEQFPGSGRTLDDAVADAFHRADIDKSEPRWFKIVEAQVLIENPIREYKVIITPSG
jgi:flavin-binding protein dodecin